MYHIYSHEELRFIEKTYKKHDIHETTRLFNEKFGLDLSENRIRAVTRNHLFISGRDGRYKPGHIPFSKGKKMLHPRSKATYFKPGTIPWNYLPVGSERINSDGYLDVKIADPKKWKAKHIIIWEAAFGPVPKGHVIIFADGNKRNVELSNLLLITRGQLAVMNRRGLITSDAELTKTGKNIANVILKISEKKQVTKR